MIEYTKHHVTVENLIPTIAHRPPDGTPLAYAFREGVQDGVRGGDLCPKNDRDIAAVYADGYAVGVEFRGFLAHLKARPTRLPVDGLSDILRDQGRRDGAAGEWDQEKVDGMTAAEFAAFMEGHTETAGRR